MSPASWACLRAFLHGLVGDRVENSSRSLHPRAVGFVGLSRRPVPSSTACVVLGGHGLRLCVPGRSRGHPPSPCVLRNRRRFSRHSARVCSGRLPQGSSEFAPPSTGPLARPPASPRARFGSMLPHTEHVPTARVLTASPDCATDGVQTCCSLLPTMGFAGFSSPETACPRPLRDVLTDATPSRAFPSTGSRTLHHCRAVPPRRSSDTLRPHRSVGVAWDATSRPCSTGESVVYARRCRRRTPEALLGFPT
jgi:hypothetical protein